MCPKSYFDLYRPAAMALPAGFASHPTAPPGVPAAAVRPTNADLFRDVDVTPSMARTATAAYFTCISYIDDQIGRLMAAVERLQLREKTVVVLMSDHGYHLGERGRWSKHGSLYELVGRVPLIIDAPGTAGRGRSSPRVVELVDLFPAASFKLAGLPPIAALQGASLVPLLQTPSAARQRPAYAQVGAGEGGAPGRSGRTERWRYPEWGLGAPERSFTTTDRPGRTHQPGPEPRLRRYRSGAQGSAAQWPVQKTAAGELEKGSGMPRLFAKSEAGVRLCRTRLGEPAERRRA